jgi:hypothetical protein
MKIRSLFAICVLFLGCAAPIDMNKSEPRPGAVVAATPQLHKGDYWVYRRGNGATFKRQDLAFAKELDFPLWVGKMWTFEQWLSRKLMTVDMRAEVVNFRPVAVAAGTFDAYEIRYDCSTRGPFRQPSCGNWTRWYAPQVGNIIATKGSARGDSTQSTWELTGFKHTQ